MRTVRQLLMPIVCLCGLAAGLVPADSQPEIELVQAESTAQRPLARLEPAQGTLFGVSLDWAADNIEAYTRRAGRTPAVYVAFTHFPIDPSDEPGLQRFTDEVQQVHGMALLTVEPTVSLASITPAMAEDLAQRLASYNDRGIPVLVRFAHEMNGSWYRWGQQPNAYIAAFRMVAAAVHEHASGSAMLWAPNYGAGYPFQGGPYAAQPGTAEFAMLDTNRDGAVDLRDDMYAPYYPGDDAVDWVGMTLYHWGDRWPWGKNVAPEPGKFLAQLTGSYSGGTGDERGLPDFYRQYAEKHSKPMAIPETAALYNTSLVDDAELEIKRAWWRQVFSPEVGRELPAIKMINWFEWRKPEAEIGDAVIDWSATTSPRVRDAFVEDLDSAALIFGSEPSAAAEDGAQSAAQAQPTSADPTAASLDVRRRLEFAGYEWRVRRADTLQGPGPNLFSDSTQTVWTDDRGRLHLRVRPDRSTGQWEAAEVALDARLGYGTYTFRVASPLDDLDANVVLGLFTWSDEPQENHRELDIEFARFGDTRQPIGRFTLQPYTEAGNVRVFEQPPGPDSMHGLTWSPGRVMFESRTATGELISQQVFTAGVPTTGDEQVHVNLWLDAGRAPAGGEPVEIILENFQFSPMEVAQPE